MSELAGLLSMNGWGTEALHWLRPLWLMLLLPLLVAWVVWARRARQTASRWRAVVDPVLQPYVIERPGGGPALSGHLLFLAWGVSLVMMAGPVWHRQPVPVFDAPASEVVLLDLSASMLATDLPPDRLSRARFKLLDLLRASQGVQVAMVGFAERPYVISPLTDDARTIAAFVPSLSPEIMPVQGSRPDLAIEQGVELLERARVATGHVILMTDARPGARDVAAAAALREAGHRLSVWAVGTAQGAPLRDANGQFVATRSGEPVVPVVDARALAELARVGGGQFTALTPDDRDLTLLAGVRDGLSMNPAGGPAGEADSAADENYWVEYAPFALPVVLLGALGFFRRGVWS